MLETYFSTVKILEHLRKGPSGPYMDGYAASLERSGYRPATAVRYLRAAAHLGHFVHEQGGSLADIDLSVFREHLRTCRCPRSKGDVGTTTRLSAPSIIAIFFDKLAFTAPTRRSMRVPGDRD